MADRSAGTVAETHAAFARDLSLHDIPPHVAQLARHCLVDALGCAMFGRQLPWSRMILAEAVETGSGGPCEIPGEPGLRLHPPQAALALGAFCHAFELDSLRKPGAGVHAGATVALPALAVAQAVGASDDDLIAAIVAGCETMFRLGAATLHTPEKSGFHAPGLTGPFGAAIACGRLMGLSATQLANAQGIAGSLASGLLAFAASGQGGMVKRLHLGRAAESGVLAARLAARGFEAPHAVIEGPYGFLDAFCSDTAPDLLTQGLGTNWALETLCLKRYACHITAHAPVEALRGMMADHGFGGAAIAEISLQGSEKLVSHHAGKAPTDIGLAQYSAPFVLALSAYRDPEDPAAFSDDALTDSGILDLMRRITVTERPGGGAKGWGVDLTVVLRDGTRLTETRDSFEGTPERPLSGEQVCGKAMRLAGDDAAEMEALCRRFLPR
ncbi:MmgE/PrpD family protein [Silicimonas algicola]|uniref:2-methylcitrate dehydratase PrpD n=1 Tax=Silicimonas algicola TaxID=1826607 RepID=A0A316GIH9_9RHOB|nr:MmgE/PrpD family protein [Silicimonas algicola]AZQ68267.1 MmgE/PrpD family protein [Silicimonas algicola]PWK54597.1 2-methylcitrate dehydratase PrpD [Silicimonas algicola]